MTEKSDTKQSELWPFVIVMSIAIIAGFSGYYVLSRVAQTKSQVCIALGKVWVTQQMEKDNPEKPEGCYTYEEFYK